MLRTNRHLQRPCWSVGACNVVPKNDQRLASYTGACFPTQVADWARLQFYAEVSKSEASLSLAKACMLIALEEEAAVASDEQQRRLGLDGNGREEALTISQMRSRGSSREPVLKRCVLLICSMDTAKYCNQSKVPCHFTRCMNPHQVHSSQVRLT